MIVDKDHRKLRSIDETVPSRKKRKSRLIESDDDDDSSNEERKIRRRKKKISEDEDSLVENTVMEEVTEAIKNSLNEVEE